MENNDPYKNRVFKTIEAKKKYISRSSDWRLKNRERANEIARESHKRNYANNKIKKKFQHIKRTYGITLEEYNNILFSQENKCAICDREFNDKIRPAIDHIHDGSGRVRGILCIKCNGVLGWYELYGESIINYLLTIKNVAV